MPKQGDKPRYVCYGNEEGGFCWGHIVDEAVVNSTSGPKEVFILEDRMTCFEGRVSRQPGRTTVRKELLNLETDIVERTIGMEELDDEELFVIIMSGSVDDVQSLNLGAKNMMKHEIGEGKVMETAKEELRQRLES